MQGWRVCDSAYASIQGLGLRLLWSVVFGLRPIWAAATKILLGFRCVAFAIAASSLCAVALYASLRLSLIAAASGASGNPNQSGIWPGKGSRIESRRCYESPPLSGFVGTHNPSWVLVGSSRFAFQTLEDCFSINLPAVVE